MWKAILNFFTKFFTTSTPGAYTIEEFNWRIPKAEKWDTIEVFTATGLLIGKGIVTISRGTRQIFVNDVEEQHFKEAFFRVDQITDGYALPMISKDYTETKVICVLIPAPPTVSETEIDAIDELQKKWIFHAHELYWEHPGNGLIPFYKADHH